MPLHRGVIGEDGDLAIVGPPQRAGILPLDADGLGPLLGEAGLVGVPERVVIGERLQDTAAQVLEDRAIGPDTGADEGLQGAHRAAAHRLGDVLGIAAFAAVKQPLDEAAGVGLILVAAEHGGEAVEFGFEGPQLWLIHDRSPRVR